MKKYLLSVFAAVILAMAFCVSTFAADVTVGSADELVAVMNDSSKWADNITLTADIDLSGKTQSAIGDYAAPFSGTFDGAGHTVKGLNVTGNGTVGLFGVVSGTVKNLTVEGRVENTFGADNAELTAETKLDEEGRYPGTGGIIGIAMSGAILENLVNKAEVVGPGNLGGVVGIIYNFGENTITATGCANYGTMKPSVGNCGGVFGRIYVKTPAATTVTDCVNYVDVTSNSADRNRLGGVVGYVRTEMGLIEMRNCRNEGVITGENEHASGSNIPYAAGIVGRAEVTADASSAFILADCVNVGTINSSRIAAGIIGYISRADACIDTATVVTGCANLADVTGSFYAGGIIAYTESKCLANTVTAIRDCANYGNVIAETCGGGILGRQVGANVENCIHLGTITGTESIGGIVGKVDGTSVCEVKNSYYLYYPVAVGVSTPFCLTDNLVALGTADVANKDVYTGLDFTAAWTMGDVAPVPAGVEVVGITVPADVVVPETTAPETTEVPETTEAPEETTEEEPEETKAPETTEAPETTTAPATTEEEGGNNVLPIIIAVVAVVVVLAVVAVVVAKKKR